MKIKSGLISKATTVATITSPYGLKSGKNINIQTTDFYDLYFLLGRHALLPMLFSPFPTDFVDHASFSIIRDRDANAQFRH